MKHYESWGRYPKVEQAVFPLYWRDDPIPFDQFSSVLPFGQGRSYGDSCLNDGGTLLDAEGLHRLIQFDPEKGILRCEAGVTLAEILRFCVPRGYFLPVTPGTRHVSIGGAIANDIHGKNHHRDGTFGCHVRGFEILRSSGERLFCSPSENVSLFRATIGGIGLTGLITWAEIQLKPVLGPLMQIEMIPFAHVDEFFSLSEDSDRKFEYTVSWIDSLARGRNLGRGIFLRGNHLPLTSEKGRKEKGNSVAIPFDLPGFLLNPVSMRAFNSFYYHWQRFKAGRRVMHYDPFFYPLDGVRDWNRMYGKNGFFQYQCVIPSDRNDPQTTRSVIANLLNEGAQSGHGSFLAVLKKFGDIPSPGLLSFPKVGTTLALDFPNGGEKTLAFLEKMDEIVRNAGGRVYIAKDARMSRKSFQAYYPEWQELEKMRDPKFSSSFWRRVTGSTL